MSPEARRSAACWALGTTSRLRSTATGPLAKPNFWISSATVHPSSTCCDSPFTMMCIRRERYAQWVGGQAPENRSGEGAGAIVGDDWAKGHDTSIMPAVMRPLMLITLMLSAAGAGGILSLCAYAVFLPAERCLPGTSVGGWEQPAERSLGEWLEERRRALRRREAYLLLPEETVEIAFGDLGIELDVARTMTLVSHSSRGTNLLGRLRRIWAARQGELRVPLVWSVDPARVAAALEGLGDLVRRPPTDAKLDLRSHRRIEDSPGRQLDIIATLRAIEAGGREDSAVFEVRTQPIPPRITSDMLANVDVSKVLASYETSFKGKAGPRAINIAVAARYLNQTVVGPGETLSFNRIVGERTLERGFVQAPVIVEDELESGVGGGVCQVATTLHAAAVFGNIDVLRRRSHSRPSGYAPLGLDATVIDGEVDLLVRNSYDSALIVHAFLPTNTTLRVELLGRSPPGVVRHSYGVEQTHPFTRRVKVKPELGPEFIKRKQKGSPGYDVVSYVSLTREDGKVSRRVYKSTYYPVPEVYWVGSEPSSSMALPALPPGAVEPPAPTDAIGAAAAPGEGAAVESGYRFLRSEHVDPAPDPFEGSPD